MSAPDTLTATPRGEEHLALDHLLSQPLEGATIVDHIRLAATDNGESVRLLAMLGLRWCPQEEMLAVACRLPADEVFLGTEWHQCHAQVLLRITGARRQKIRISGIPIPQNAVLVPMAALRAPRRSARPQYPLDRKGTAPMRQKSTVQVEDARQRYQAQQRRRDLHRLVIASAVLGTIAIALALWIAP
tara:strand:+ start:1090 stop:1653 length:564 start_codon:yes stop_codon:yes gene_type:complete